MNGTPDERRLGRRLRTAARAAPNSAHAPHVVPQPTASQLAKIPRAVPRAVMRGPLGLQAMASLQDKLKRDIVEFGWHVLNVMPDPSNPPFSYSVGLFGSYGHPELVIVGLDSTTAHTLINNVGEEVREGGALAEGSRYDHILEGYDVAVVRVDQKHYPAHFGQAIDFYASEDFSVFQLVWPDRDGRFPWDAGFDSALAAVQPVLSAGLPARPAPRPN